MTGIRTLIIESVNAIYGRGLMVPAQEEKVLGVLDFVGEQETDRFDRLLTAIDIVAEEEVIGLGWKTPVLEQT